MPRLKPRFHAQEEARSCLPACLRMVLSAYSVDVSEKELRKLCRWHPLLATSTTAIVAAAKTLGFVNSREDRGLSLYDLRDFLRRDLFPIVGIQLQPFGLVGDHSQVLVSITSRFVEVYDPLLLPLTTRHTTFEEAWKLGGHISILIE